VAAATALLLLALAAIALAWATQQRVQALEAELVRRQQDAGSAATEARVLARDAAEQARAVAAKTALLEARLAETSLQRTQLDELMQTLLRSRDDSLLAEIDAGLRVAVQQGAITGSVEPLVVALTQAQERLAQRPQPRLEAVRRAVAQDLERVRGAGGADLGLLSLRLDEAVRAVDELPLLLQAQRGAVSPPSAASAAPSAPTAGAPQPTPAGAQAQASADAPAGPPPDGWRAALAQRAQALWDATLREARALVRVSRIDQPEALLLAPEQAFFLRENLKLRLLNARLALLSRQFDAAQADLRDAQRALERYFDPDARRVQVLREQLREVALQARLVGVPRPDATLAAIAVVGAGR
jgi:uroporphyrin-3 C-methyltransferase